MHELLPMFGQTHGNRSAVTCHLKCASACAHPAPNTSTEPTFAEIARKQLSRRSVLVGTGAIAAVAALPTTAQVNPAPPAPRTAGLPFAPIEPISDNVDDLIVPSGYQWHAILRWGDPLFSDAKAFNPEVSDSEAQERQFGYNNDYLDILVTDRLGRRALLCCNHEYTNREIMFPPTGSAAEEREVLKATMAATGFSVVELRRTGKGRPWRYVKDGDKNRRITAYTPFTLTGPAAGIDLVKTAADPTGRRVFGTFGNCAGGTTPWGTIMSGEENFQNYFLADGSTPQQTRYGVTDKEAPSGFGWEAVDPRFDGRAAADGTPSGYVNEPNRFGYIVEIDPHDPTSTPRKHTAMGRFKHEGANVRVDRNGTVVAYMGDDERFDYLYKFVAKRKYRPGKSAAVRRHNKQILTTGDLYVAKFSGTMRPDGDNLGRGAWIPLTLNGRSMVPGMTEAEVCVYTRLAADIVKATPMDRPEDVEPNLKTGKVYLACTNNVDRGMPGKPGADAPNPRAPNKDGHVIELAEHRNRADATTFAWNIFMLCGNPDDPTILTYFAGWDGPVSPISCPDNVAFDSTDDHLWVATDGAPGTINYLDGLFRVPLDGAERGHVEQFLAVPREAETCGPVIHDRDGSVFVAVQHPGEDGSWDDQHSFFPDYVPAGREPRPGAWRGPRPSVIQVTRKRS
ncbi:MAG TPA: PhoX family phosphatase [Propionibacteriaceae bacterium]|nr:PhoX family phosphatase [Propionibacteriaceae bacterium]